jgi:ADP-ribose pyrophosphatase
MRAEDGPWSQVPPELLSPPLDVGEVTLGREDLFEGRILRLHRDRVRLPGGGQGEREVVDHPGAVAVLPVTDSRRIVLVWQFRQAAQKAVLEIPAGKLGPGEMPVDCARRELKEETGFEAQRLTPLGRFLPSPGFSGEWLHLYVAEGLIAGTAEPDADEFLATVEATPAELQALLARGAIEDLKTAAAFLWWQSGAAPLPGDRA